MPVPLVLASLLRIFPHKAVAATLQRLKSGLLLRGSYRSAHGEKGCLIYHLSGCVIDGEAKVQELARIPAIDGRNPVSLARVVIRAWDDGSLTPEVACAVLESWLVGDQRAQDEELLPGNYDQIFEPANDRLPINRPAGRHVGHVRTLLEV